MNPLLTSFVPDQVSLWAANVVIHASVLTAISLLVAMQFRKTAVVRYWILCCGMLLVVGSPAISALIQKRGSSWLSLAAPLADAPIVDESVDLPKTLPSVTETIPAMTVPDEFARRSLDVPHVLRQSTESEAAPPSYAEVPLPIVETAPTADWGTSVRSVSDWNRIIAMPLLIVWATGTFILLVRMSVGWIRLSRILSQATPIENDELLRSFDQACGVVGCSASRAPRFVASDAVTGPIAAGILRGTVVLPKKLIDQVEPSELAEVLVHEVAHVVRRDQIVVLVQNLVSAIYWPHPLVRKLNRELAKAREEVCDNFVLASTEAPIYSRTLLSLAQHVQRHEAMPGSVGFFASRWKLEQRVAGLLDSGRNRATLLGKRGWLMLVAATLGLVALMCVGTITVATARVDDDTTEVSLAETPITVDGTVTGPDAEPVAGARVIAIRHYRANISWNTSSEILAETISDANGKYTIEVPASSAQFSDGKHLQKQFTTIMATHAGFGPDEQNVHVSTTGNLRLAAVTAPIQGRVLDLEGLPIAGVRVKLQSVEKPNDDFGKTRVVDKWIEQAKSNPQVITEDAMADPFGGGANTDPVIRYPSGERIDGIACLGIEAITDVEGRFRFDDIGDDRLATLRMDGPTIASLIVPVVAREMQPVDTPQSDPRYRTGKTFGNQFNIAVEPTQIVHGTVRDRMTRRPIPGVTVGLYQHKSLQSIHGFLSSTTDSEGKYRLSGLPRNRSVSASLVLSVEPPSDQPYFRSKHDVPGKDGLEPIEFDVDLTRGVWAEGQVADAETGEPVPSMVGYHPLIDNAHAQGHEAFNPGITSMGYDELFATDADGRFRVPSLRGKGVLRVVAANSYDYQLVPVPGTKIEKSGARKTGKRQIYHVIMPGNAVVKLDIPEGANDKRVNVKLERAASRVVRVLDPDGKAATGFYVAGRVDTRRMTLTGRGAGFWSEEVSASSTIDVMLGERSDRDQPLILFDPDRDLTAVLWPNELAQDQASPLQVRLQKCAKVVGQLITADGQPLSSTGIVFADVSHINRIGKRKRFSLRVATPTDSQGRFELSVPPDNRVSVIFYLGDTETTLLDIKALESKESIDLGTIDATTDPTSWPKPKRTTTTNTTTTVLTAARSNLRFTGRVVNKDEKPIEGAELRFIGVKAGEPGSRSELLATTDVNGKFEFERTMPSIEQSDLRKRMKYARLVSSKPGYGVAATRAVRVETTGQLAALLTDKEKQYLIGKADGRQPLAITMPTDKNRVRGRILNTDGQPVSGAKVAAINVYEGKAGSLDEWRAETKRPGANYYSARAKLDTVASGSFINEGPLPTSVPIALTDSQGNFELPGLGDDRIAELIVSHESIETSLIYVRSEAGETIELPEDSDGRLDEIQKYHPNRFTFVAGATRAVVGRLLDYETGKPVAGATVEGYRTRTHRSGGSIPPRAVRDVSAADGSFRLVGFPIGKSEIRIRPPVGSAYMVGGVIVTTRPKNKEVARDIKMRKGVMQRGRIVENGTDRPVSGYFEYWPLAENTAIAETPMLKNGDQRFRYMVDAEGNFEIPVLSGRGILTLMANDDQRFQRGAGVEAITWSPAPDFNGVIYHTYPHYLMPANRHFLAPIDLEPGEVPEPMNIRLDAGVEIPVHITGTDGTPMDIVYFSGQRPFGGWQESSFDGLFVHGYEPDVGRNVIVYHAASESMAAVALKGKSPKSLDLKLIPSGRVTGRVVDDAGEPIRDAVILNGGENYQARDDIGSELSMFPDRIDGKPLLTDQNGRFSIGGLFPGKKYAARAATRSTSMNRTLGELFVDVMVDGGETKNLGDLVPTEKHPSPNKKASNSVSGQVLDPSGKPIAAALWVGGPARSGDWSRTPMSISWKKVGTSTEDGRFQVSIPQPEDESSKSDQLRVRLAATADGLGFAWRDVPIEQTADEVILRLVKDTPIRGRIVTLDGTPAANVRLDVVAVVAPDSLPESAEFIKNAQLSSGVYTNWPAWPGGSPLTKSAVTDSDGRFLLSGLGSERHVRLQALRDGLAATRLSIVTREKPSDSASGAIAVRTGLRESKYFADFTHVAVPERIVRGTVVDQTNGKPIPDVRIVTPTSWASRKSPAVTDESGKFVIRHVPKATEYRLELSPRGTKHFRSELTVPDPAGSEPLDVKLALASSIQLRGRVVDEVSGEGVQAEIVYNPLFPNDAIELLGAEDVANPLSKVQTETDGSFEIPVLPGPGAISAEVKAEKYATALLKEPELRTIFPEGDLEARPDAMGQFKYLPTAGGNQSLGIMGLSGVHAVKLLSPSQDDALKEIELSLRHSLALQGEIFDQQGNPVSGVTVVGLGPSSTSMTDEPLETNQFSVTGLLPESERTLLFLQPDRALGAIVNVKGDQSGPVKVELKPTGSVTGSLLNLDGDPITNGYVNMKAERISLLTGLWDAKVDDQGRFTVDNLPAGEAFFLHARIQGYRLELSVRADVRTKSGEQLDLGAFRQKNRNQFKAVEMSANPSSQAATR